MSGRREGERDDGGDFIPVKRRGKRRTGFPNNQNNQEENLSNGLNYGTHENEDNPTNLTSEELIRKLEIAKGHLKRSGFFAYIEELLTKECLDKLRPNDSKPNSLEIVSYGLGSFTTCFIARYQLALLTLIQETLKRDDQVMVELFDPIFNSQDKEILTTLGFQVLEDNEEGKRSVGETLTLFYLPHCSHQLVNNLLYANWSPKQLNACIIISNSFSLIQNSLQPKILSKYLRFVSQTVDICDEVLIKNTFEHSNIFNDTSIHIFPKSKLELKSGNFWLEKTLPYYKDHDFITKT